MEDPIFSNSDLYATAGDSSSDEDISPQRNPLAHLTNSQPKRDMPPTPPPSNDSIDKPKRKTRERNKMTKSDIKRMHSESQRLIRESDIRLPHYQPKLKTLDSFLTKINSKASSKTILLKKATPKITSLKEDKSHDLESHDKENTCTNETTTISTLHSSTTNLTSITTIQCSTSSMDSILPPSHNLTPPPTEAPPITDYIPSPVVVTTPTNDGQPEAPPTTTTPIKESLSQSSNLCSNNTLNLLSSSRASSAPPTSVAPPMTTPTLKTTSILMTDTFIAPPTNLIPTNTASVALSTELVPPTIITAPTSKLLATPTSQVALPKSMTTPTSQVATPTTLASSNQMSLTSFFKAPPTSPQGKPCPPIPPIAPPPPPLLSSLQDWSEGNCDITVPQLTPVEKLQRRFLKQLMPLRSSRKQVEQLDNTPGAAREKLKNELQQKLSSQRAEERKKLQQEEYEMEEGEEREEEEEEAEFSDEELSDEEQEVEQEVEEEEQEVDEEEQEVEEEEQEVDGYDDDTLFVPLRKVRQIISDDEEDDDDAITTHNDVINKDDVVTTHTNTVLMNNVLTTDRDNDIITKDDITMTNNDVITNNNDDEVSPYDTPTMDKTLISNGTLNKTLISDSTPVIDRTLIHVADGSLNKTLISDDKSLVPAVAAVGVEEDDEASMGPLVYNESSKDSELYNRENRSVTPLITDTNNTITDTIDNSSCTYPYYQTFPPYQLPLTNKGNLPPDLNRNNSTISSVSDKDLFHSTCEPPEEEEEEEEEGEEEEREGKELLINEDTQFLDSDGFLCIRDKRSRNTVTSAASSNMMASFKDPSFSQIQELCSAPFLSGGGTDPSHFDDITGLCSGIFPATNTHTQITTSTSSGEEEEEEDNMPLLNRKRSKFPLQKGDRLKNYYENEAELSGSDVGSDDEEEDEEEVGGESFDEGAGSDVPSDSELWNQVNEAHIKQLVDDDKAELRDIKERFLVEGDLFEDGLYMKNGFFRSRHFTRMGGGSETSMDLFSHTDREQEVQEEEEGEMGSQVEAKRRRERLEKEEFIRKCQENSNPLSCDEDSQSILGLIRETSINHSLLNTPNTSVINELEPLSSSSSSSIKRMRCGSFLKHNSSTLQRLSSITNTTPTLQGGGRSFVFKAGAGSTPLSSNSSKSNNSSFKRPKLDRSISLPNKGKSIFDQF